MIESHEGYFLDYYGLVGKRVSPVINDLELDSLLEHRTLELGLAAGSQTSSLTRRVFAL